MPEVKLTDAFVRNAKGQKTGVVEYQDTKERGLTLRVTKSGVRSYSFRYRDPAGKQRRLQIGRQDDLSLADARARTIEARAVVASGEDPKQLEDQAKKDALASLNRKTVEDIGAWYFRECEAGRHKPNAKRPKRQKTIELETYYFRRRIVPKLGGQNLQDLSRADLQAFVDGLSDDHSPSTARQVRIILHALFEFGIRHEIVDANPTKYVSVAPFSARETVLTDEQLRMVWQALCPPIDVEGASVTLGTAYAIRLAMVTLQRRAEVTGMRIDEIDRELKLWTIPSHRTKNHRRHVVPLSDLSLTLIDAALQLHNEPSDFVFPSPRDASRPIQPAAMTRAFNRVKKALDLGDIRPHDFRRTGATQLTGERLGFPRFIVSKVLNHTSDAGGGPAVTGIYDQNEYLPEKRKALNAWADRLVETIQ